MISANDPIIQTPCRAESRSIWAKWDSAVESYYNTINFLHQYKSDILTHELRCVVLSGEARS